MLVVGFSCALAMYVVLGGVGEMTDQEVAGFCAVPIFVFQIGLLLVLT